MRQKHNMQIYTCIWIFAILILIVSLSQTFGDAKVINYSGIVRGATQKLIKKELHGQPDDKLIAYLDGILHNLQTGEGKYDLIRLKDASYQSQLNDMDDIWQSIKTEIHKVRAGESQDTLYNLSEKYFTMANEMVATAQDISDHKLYSLIHIFIVYLFVTVSGFILWYKYKQKQLKKAMYTDKLTGINNYSAFEIELKQKLGKADGTYALLCLDIDDFKYLNSIYGSQIGDLLLITLAQTLLVFAGEKGCCARYGNDEFFLMCEYSNDTTEYLKEALRTNIKESIELDIYNDLSICMGIYILEKDNEIKNIIDNAGLAHKHAKKAGKGAVTAYNQELLNDLYIESKIASQMHKALSEQEFKLYLQPKFEIPSLKIVGAEALVRWHEKNGSILYPDEFIPFFEQNGFIYKLDFCMLEQVCLFIKKHHLETSDFRISVNFSRVTIHHQDFSEDLKSIILKYEVPVHCLELEITENVFNDFSESIMSMLNNLCKEGYVFSMDDFGAGYSSLNSLHTMPVDIIKIDRAFLKESHDSQNVVSIIRFIIETAHLLGKEIICEGVEVQEDAVLLDQLNCHLGQGFYVSKPVYWTAFVEKFLN